MGDKYLTKFFMEMFLCGKPMCFVDDTGWGGRGKYGSLFLQE